MTDMNENKKQVIGDDIVPTTTFETHSVDKKEALENSQHYDVGLHLYTQSLEVDPARRDEIAKRILKKLDYALLPVVSLERNEFSSLDSW
jgi:hypothetical protein